MHVSAEERCCVGEKRGCRVGRWRSGHARSGRTSLIHFIEAIARYVRQYAALAIAPFHLDGDQGVTSGGECQLRVAARQVVASGRDLATLCGERSCAHRDHSADAGVVRCCSAQAHGDARSAAFIPVDYRRSIQAGDEHVEVTVAVEVGERDAL